MKETKYISLREFKAITDGPGGFRGYVTKFGELDDVGDIILPGAYTDTIEQFLKRGFTADSHDWSFGGGMIGYPISAKEDKTGLLCETKFHSTPDAQSVRTKAQERQEAGLDTFLSIGYEIDGKPIMVYSADYAAELPKYVGGEQLQAALAKAASFRQVRVIPKVHLYEYSLVTVPALQSAAVTGVKSGSERMEVKKIDIKGAFEDALSERTNRPWNLWDTFMCVYWEIQMNDEAAEQLGMAYDFAGAVSEAVDEFATRLKASIIEEDAEEDASDGDGEDDGDLMGAMAMRGLGLRLADGRGYTAHLKAVADAAEGLIRRTEGRIDLRVKEGRMLSGQNETMLADLADSLAGHSDNIKKLLDSNAKTDPAKAAEIQREQKLRLAELADWFVGQSIA
jgi:HK97 family phage prohead protease